MILEYFIFLISLIKIEAFLPQNKDLVDTLIRHYSIQNIVMVSEQMLNLDIYFKHSLMENVTFEIFSEWDDEFKYKINTDYNYLLFFVANNFDILYRISQLSLGYIYKKSKLVIAIVHRSTGVFEFVFNGPYSQVLFIINGELFKFTILTNSNQNITSAQDFIETDPYEIPGFYWPKLRVEFTKSSPLTFPILIGEKNPTTGLLFYFKTTFEGYYENFRNRISSENYLEHQHYEKNYHK